MSTITSSQSKNNTAKSAVSLNTERAKLQRMLQCYPADRQVKYLHLQAEIDVLIQQLQTLKQQTTK